jgi:hypothetical protein
MFHAPFKIFGLTPVILSEKVGSGQLAVGSEEQLAVGGGQ